MTLSLPLCTDFVKPLLKDTLDDDQKTFRCWNRETLVRWRRALGLRYCSWSDPRFSVLWQDTDHANNVSDNIDSVFSVSDIAKTFVQVCTGDDKCITITVYFVKTATRKKGCGSCLVQGKYCYAWVKHEFEALCCLMESLNDAGTGDPSAVPDTPMMLPASSDSMNTVVDTNTTDIGLIATTKTKATTTTTDVDTTTSEGETTATDVGTITTSDEETTTDTDAETSTTDVGNPRLTSTITPPTLRKQLTLRKPCQTLRQPRPTLKQLLPMLRQRRPVLRQL